VKKDDDFVESSVWISSDALGSLMINRLEMEMKSLESLANILWGKVVSYYKELKADNGKKINTTHAGKMASEAVSIFWHLCEKDFQGLVTCCDQRDEDAQALQPFRNRFSDYVQQAYDQFCPRETARQLDAWAKCRPNNSKYLKQEM
jgi:CRISPR system Cascade subunit CasA